MFHILVVDDDKHTRKLLRAVLENAHYTVTTATNGEEALEALDKEHIDLVVLDIMMPKMDGYEFTRFVRETDNALPILMVTAKHLPADEKRIPCGNRRLYHKTDRRGKAAFAYQSIASACADRQRTENHDW